jgi:hypothetical protein
MSYLKERKKKKKEKKTRIFKSKAAMAHIDVW